MNIEIPDNIAKEVGIFERTNSEIEVETVELGDRIPTEVTGSKYPNGIIIYVKEN